MCLYLGREIGKCSQPVKLTFCNVTPDPRPLKSPVMLPTVMRPSFCTRMSSTWPERMSMFTSVNPALLLNTPTTFCEKKPDSITFYDKILNFWTPWTGFTVPSRLQGSIIRPTSTVYPTWSETVQNGSKCFLTQFINQLTKITITSRFQTENSGRKPKNCIIHRTNRSYPRSRKG